MNDMKPQVTTGRKLGAIWIIPIVALVIGIYMVIHTKMSEGPEISITFATAEGLEAGKTKVRYRNVDIGLVEEVSLSKGMDTVVATVKMERDAVAMLRKDTRFWVVRARVGAGSISGLGTLLSGAYIRLDPGVGAKGKREYTGLDVPPLTPAEAPGVRLVLYSENAGSVSAGDAVLYNGFKVGRIEGVTLDSKKQEVRYDAFIDAPYDDLVTSNSRFWNISGIAVDASADGVSVQTGSLDTILLGGVAFGSLPGQPAGEKAPSGAVYKLAASFQQLEEDPYRFGMYFVVEFSQSLRGLKPGAPVEYRGIQLGQVRRIMLQEMVGQSMAAKGEPIPVLIYVEPGRLGVGDAEEHVEQIRRTIGGGVERGLRASLQTGSLLTGSLFVNLDYYPDAQPATVGEFQGYPVIPSMPSGLGRLEGQVSSLLDKFNALPLEDTVANINNAVATLNGTLVAMTATLTSADTVLAEPGTRQLPAELNKTLADLRKTLDSFSSDSAVGKSLSNSIFELNATLRNLENLTRTLSDQPSSVVFPTEFSPDPIPEGSAQ